MEYAHPKKTHVMLQFPQLPPGHQGAFDRTTDIFLCGSGSAGQDYLDKLHAAVKVGVDGEHERAVSNRLHELRQADLVSRQEHYGWDARVRAVR
jgi:hypothetical protein